MDDGWQATLDSEQTKPSSCCCGSYVCWSLRAIVSGRLWGRSFTGTWRQSTGDGEVALEFTPDFRAAEGWWTLPHEPARHRAFIRARRGGKPNGNAS